MRIDEPNTTIRPSPCRLLRCVPDIFEAATEYLCHRTWGILAASRSEGVVNMVHVLKICILAVPTYSERCHGEYFEALIKTLVAALRGVDPQAKEATNLLDIFALLLEKLPLDTITETPAAGDRCAICEARGVVEGNCMFQVRAL